MGEFDLDAVMQQRGWEWRENSGYTDLIELWDADRMLAWICRRPAYCDRGHWQVEITGVPDMDGADAFPRYFMRLATAQQELIEFLLWRLFKMYVSD